MTGAAGYRFGDTLALDVEGPARVRAHLAREYADHAVEDSQDRSDAGDLARVIAAPAAAETSAAAHTAVLIGRHKLARWRVTVEASPNRQTLQLGIRAHGPLAPLLVQSMVIEPALGLAGPWRQSVLVPAAAVLIEGGATLIVGAARTGKSTLAARLAASQADVLADDLVVLGGDGRVSPIRRRVRLYDDFADNAPQAHARFPVRLRRSLLGRRALRRLTLGTAAPPLLIPPASLGFVTSDSAPALRSLLVVAVGHGVRPALEPLDRADAVPAVLELAGRERFALHGADGHGWEPFIRAQTVTERAVLERVLSGVQVQRLDTPAGWDVGQRVALIERVLRGEM